MLRTIVAPDTYNFTYWDVGPLKEVDYPTHLKEQYWLTNRNQIDSMRTYNPTTSATIYRYTYRYNPLVDRDSMDIYLSRPLSTAITGYVKYSYDNLRRLTNSKPMLSISLDGFEYAYDPAGNRTSRQQGKTVINYTYNKPNNHLTSDGTNTYSYDDNGNLPSIAPPQEVDYYYTWDYENRLTKIKKSGSGKNDSLMLTYCGFGKRIKKVHASDPDTTRYCFDGMNVVAEFGDTDTLTSKYIYANGLLFDRYDASGVKYYYHHDGLGSTIGITDANKALAISYLYDDFGKVIDKTGTISN